jgi:PAS domain-containing protein
MRPRGFARIVSSVFDAALTPELWPAALGAITEAVDAIGAAYIVRNKETARTEWISLSGPSVELTAEYVSYYSMLDPYSPVLEHTPQGRWLRLSKCLPQSKLRTDEWYNDFVVRSGVGDILGTRLSDGAGQATVFGMHQPLKGALAVPRAAWLDELFQVLSKAASLQRQLHSLRWNSSIGLRALDRLAAGVIVTDGAGRVIQMNKAAERIVGTDDGLAIRSDRLCLRCPSEDVKLTKSIADAAAMPKTSASVSRMTVARGDGRMACVLTVAPLGGDLAIHSRPLVLVMVADPEVLSASEQDLADFFRLSPDEGRLAIALMSGKRLADIAVASGLQIATLQTQLRAVLRKIRCATPR